MQAGEDCREKANSKVGFWGVLTKEWTEVGVTAPRATTAPGRGLNNDSNAHFASHSDTKVPGFGGKMERHTIQDALSPV